MGGLAIVGMGGSGWPCVGGRPSIVCSCHCLTCVMCGVISHNFSGGHAP